MCLLSNKFLKALIEQLLYTRQGSWYEEAQSIKPQGIFSLSSIHYKLILKTELNSLSSHMQYVSQKVSLFLSFLPGKHPVTDPSKESSMVTCGLAVSDNSSLSSHYLLSTYVYHRLRSKLLYLLLTDFISLNTRPDLFISIP